MPQVETGVFTVGVFQDVQWAEKGLEALKRHGFPPEALSIIAKDGGDVAALVTRALGTEGEIIDVRELGALRVAGSLVEALQGPEGHLLSRRGLAGTMHLVGFQQHDGFIYETLTARGGVLVAARGEPRAADALAVLHAYGGGNAAIGAWIGRV